MTGAIFQLNVKGPQDKFLTGKPEHNFIKQVYKRHVNFSIQKTSIHFKNTVNFGKKIEVDIPRKGDFLHKLYFKFTLPPLVYTSGTYAGWTNSVGHALVDYVELSIGGHIIDKHYGLFLEIWNELTQKASLNSAENLLVGKYHQLESLEFNALYESTYEVPLIFWFCNTLSSALPLLNLHFHPVKLIFNLRPFDECIVYDGITPPNSLNITSASLLAEYIFIEDSERLKYFEKESMYLINQVQSLYGESINLVNGHSHKSILNFNHPCSDLMFVLREKDSDDNNDWFNFAKRVITPLTIVPPLITNSKFIVDGKERIEETDEYTLRLSNNFRFHGHAPHKHIYTMSFCNDPQKWFPTGSLNFSCIDQAELYLTMANSIASPVKLFVFARNFNIMYIKNGMIQIGYND
jgi:hypothetical protein